MARLAPAHVFQVLQSVFLAVEVVGPVARFCQQTAFFQHGGDVGVVVLLLVLNDDARSALEGEGVHGNVLRVQRDGLPQAALKTFYRVAGQAGDQVHVDIIMTGLARFGIAVQNVLRRVFAPNARQHLVREGLRVDGDAGSAVFLDDRQLFGIRAVRTACLHRIFHDLRKVKIRPDRAHQLPQLVGRQAGGRAAADVDAAQFQACLVCLNADLFHLSAQTVHIRLHHLAVAVQIAADKAAVAAPGRAERDADVQAVGPGFIAHFQNWLLQVGNGLGHLVFLLGAVEPVKEEAVDLRFRPACGALVVDEPHRAHTGHFAPWRADAGPIPQQIIGQAGKAEFRGLAALFHRRGQRCVSFSTSAVLTHQCMQAVRRFFCPDAVLGVLRRGEGERCHGVKQTHQMLHFVAGRQAGNINLHVVHSLK